MKMSTAELARNLYNEEIKKHKKAIEELEEALINLEYSGKRWKPKKSEKYFYIDCEGDVDHCNANIEIEDDKSYQIGNCFRTEEEAEFEAERLRVIAELKEFVEGDEAVWNGDIRHWYFYYDTSDKEICYHYGFTTKTGQFYFPSGEATKAAIEAVGEDRIKKYYLRVKE